MDEYTKQEDMPAFRIWLCGAFRVERRVGTAYEVVRTAEWGGSSYPRLLLKALLCCPGRQARREALIELLWPDAEPEQAAQYLHTATTKLRKVLEPGLCQASLLVTEEDAKYCLLESSSAIWVDAETALTLLKEAERRGRSSQEALPFLEEAAMYLRRGTFLDGEDGLWAAGKRATIERARYRCQLWLADAYEQQRMPGQAEAALSLLLEEDPTDEDVLCRLMELLHRQGMTQQALRLYQQTCEVLTREGISPTDAVRQLAARLDAERHTQTIAFKAPVPVVSHFSLASVQGILSVVSEEGRETTDHARRYIIEQTLKGASAALLAASVSDVHRDMIGRLTHALSRPSALDTQTLLYLQRRIETYWQDRQAVTIPAGKLVSFVLEDLHKITLLLEGSVLPTVRLHLCSLAGAAAMLIGELYFDLCQYPQARVFQELAISAAQQANNKALEAVAWARHSFAWTYEHHPDEACQSIQHARQFAGSVNALVRPWLAAVEAEIRAHLGHRESCLSALREAAQVEDQQQSQAECYWIHFDRSLCAGYQGISFLQLARLGHNDLLSNAQTALQDALELLDPSLQRRQPTLLVDLAGTYVQQHEIEQACACALKAITIAAQIHSKMSVQRLLTLRESLEAWNGTSSVQELDQAVRPLLSA
jgi:DNA-binding SARP family transcriptional activator